MDTLSSHSLASDYRMRSQASSATDTGLMGIDFNALEIFNPGLDSFDQTSAWGVLNDWFTLLSHGQLVAGTGVSDTHQMFATAAGYWRSYVHVGVDSPTQVIPQELSNAVNAMKVVATNGPFVRFTAQRLDAQGHALGTPVESGGTVPMGAGDVQYTVEVQVPEGTDISKIELYTHSSSDDASCPIQSSDPNANTTRVGCNGLQANRWPNTAIYAQKQVVLAPGDREVVATVGGTQVKRIRHTETFRLPAPAQDAWVVAFVYGESDLFPLVYAGLDSSGAHKVAKPFAVANPILVDADGGGFDKPPFHPRTAPRPCTPRVNPSVNRVGSNRSSSVATAP